MKILITGCTGQLGHELIRVLEERVPGVATGLSHKDFDITDAQAVEDILRKGQYTHVVNCAAYTAVDRAEEDKLQCSKVNVEGARNLAALAETLNYKLLHISTDYVFDGLSHKPYRESDKPEPQSVYGTTKRKGEVAMLGLDPNGIIIRTGWLYDSSSHNFMTTMLRLAQEGKPLKVVFDQIGTPTFVGDLANAICDILCSGLWQPGIYHYSNEGVASWYDFAVAILEAAGFPEAARNVIPIPSEDYPTAAKRPLYSVLDKRKIKASFGLKIPHWQDGLRRCISKLN